MVTPVLHTSRLILDPINESYLSNLYVSWLNDPNVHKYLESGGDYSLDKLREYYISQKKKNVLFWAILTKEGMRHIGNIKIEIVSSGEELYAEYAIMLGESSEWGKGFARESSTTAFRHCFLNLKVKKLYLGVVEDNVSAFELYKKMGFLIDPRQEKEGVYEGKKCKVYRMVLYPENMRFS